MMKGSYSSVHIDWNGIRIEIRYCPDWMGLSKSPYRHAFAHLKIESVQPANAPLPITETGYRSHFTWPDAIDAAGGPAEFVRAWLDDAAKNPEWIAAQEKRKQLSLF